MPPVLRGSQTIRPLVIAVSLLLLLIASAVLLLGPATAQTDPPTSGDWTVADATIVENQTVRLKGNLTVSNGGNLLLRNVTLQVYSGPIEGTNGITVEANGTLRIEDYDKSPSDKDRSTVMRGRPSFGYFFVAKPGSTLILLNSNISGMGARPVSRGVLVQTDNATITGMFFIDGDEYGVRIEGSDGPTISNSAFYLSDYGLVLKDTVNVTVTNSGFSYNSRDGIWLDNATSTRVSGCLISNNNIDGLVVSEGVDLRVVDTVFYENTNGVVLNAVSDVLIDECQINKTAFTGLLIEEGTKNVSLYDVDIFDIGRTGIEGDGVQDLSLDGCTIRNCTYFGIRLLNGTFGLMMNENEVVGNGYDGIHIEGALAVHMNMNTISRNGYNGLFMINSRDIRIHNTSLDNNNYDGINFDSVSEATIDLISASENGYAGVYIQAGSNRTRIERSQFFNNTRSGMAIDSANDIFVIGCNFTQNQDYGIRIDSGTYLVRLEDCLIVKNAIGGIRVDNSQDIIGRRVTLLGVGAHVALYVRDSGYIWVQNSTLVGTVDVIGRGNATIVDPTSETFGVQVMAGSWLDLAYWVEVEVIWPDLDPVDGATVNITSINGSRRSTRITDENGTTGIFPLTIRTWDGGAPFDLNPFTIKAGLGDEWAGQTLRITNNTHILIILQDSIPPVPVALDIWVELNSMAVLDGTASYDNGLVVSWTWTFDDGVGTVVLGGPTVSWTFTELGNFQGELNITDQVGLANSTTFTIHVEDTTAPIVAVGDNMEVDQHTHVELNGTGTWDNDHTLVLTGTFTWSIFEEGNKVPIGTLETFFGGWVFEDMGNYTIRLVVIDQSGNEGNASFRVVVRDVDPPLVDGGPDKSVDQGASVKLEPVRVADNDPAFSPYNATRWRILGPSGDVNLTGFSIEWAPEEMGVYQAIVYVRDAAGNEGTDIVFITVWDLTAPFAVAGEDRTVDIGAVVVLDAFGTADNDPEFPSGAEYSWTVIGPDLGLDLVGENVSFQVPWIGVYTVTLEVTDAAGNTGRDTIRITSIDPWAPTYGGFFPESDLLNDLGEMSVLQFISDRGTGVNADLLEMRIKASGGEWTTWTVVDVGDSANSVEALIDVDLPEGESLIQFRCWDLAGNGPAVSDEHRVRVNSRPVVVVLSPVDGADYGPFDEVWLDGTPTNDPDEEDLLSYLWISDRDGALGTAPRVRSPTLSPGVHLISFQVTDGIEGHEIVFVIRITVAPEPSTVQDDDGTPWFIWIVILILVLGTMYVVWDAMVKRQRPPPAAEDEEWIEAELEENDTPDLEPEASQLISKRLYPTPLIEGRVR